MRSIEWNLEEGSVTSSVGPVGPACVHFASPTRDGKESATPSSTLFILATFSPSFLHILSSCIYLRARPLSSPRSHQAVHTSIHTRGSQLASRPVLPGRPIDQAGNIVHPIPWRRSFKVCSSICDLEHVAIVWGEYIYQRTGWSIQLARCLSIRGAASILIDLVPSNVCSFSCVKGILTGVCAIYIYCLLLGYFPLHSIHGLGYMHGNWWRASFKQFLSSWCWYHM